MASFKPILGIQSFSFVETLFLMVQLRTPCKGSLTQDFELQVFFTIQCPPGSECPIRTISDFYRKFAVIFANQRFSAVKEENFEVQILLRAYLSALYSRRLNFCLFFVFRSRQAGIDSTVLSAVSLTPGKNFRVFYISDRYEQQRGKVLLLVSLSPAIIVHRCR